MKGTFTVGLIVMAIVLAAVAFLLFYVMIGYVKDVAFHYYATLPSYWAEEVASVISLVESYETTANIILTLPSGEWEFELSKEGVKLTNPDGDSGYVPIVLNDKNSITTGSIKCENHVVVIKECCPGVVSLGC